MADDQAPVVSTDTPTPPNSPDITVVETPTLEPEPTPAVIPEAKPVDVPIPNFRFPFNGDFPVTFAFNTQATTDEMRAKFAEWGISGHHGIDFGLPEETKVSEGQEINSGDLIGISGQTGAAFGPHLHFGIKPNNPNENNGYLGFIDPTQYLPSIMFP